MAAGDVTEVAFVLEDAVGEIAAECKLPRGKVQSAAALLGEGNTIPFVARYRKECTGGLGRNGPSSDRGCDRTRSVS